METVNLPRLLLAAPASGSGKTTVSCAILRALVKRGMRVASFKSFTGPQSARPILPILTSILEIGKPSAAFLRMQAEPILH